ncbi:RNase H domain-containing protein [Trichonephila clavipes]|nr:RNase H domain-containing protein [Trichonephila clavipes]
MGVSCHESFCRGSSDLDLGRTLWNRIPQQPLYCNGVGQEEEAFRPGYVFWQTEYAVRRYASFSDDPAGNQSADRLAKEARNLNYYRFVNITLLDANAVANFKLREKSIPVNHQICDISGDRLTTKAIARLRTGHYRGMKLDGVVRRSYQNFDNCLDTELTSAHIFDCPAILAIQLKSTKY